MHVPYQQNFIHPVTQKLTIHLAYEKTLLHSISQTVFIN